MKQNDISLLLKKPVDIELSKEIKEFPSTPPDNNVSVLSIMAGRTPISESELKAPRSLKKVLVGDATATEIRWIGVESK